MEEFIKKEIYSAAKTFTVPEAVVDDVQRRHLEYFSNLRLDEALGLKTEMARLFNSVKK